jgi:hypothetical protein
MESQADSSAPAYTQGENAAAPGCLFCLKGVVYRRPESFLDIKHLYIEAL